MCRAVAREVRAGAVRGIALFVRGQVAKVSLHRCEVGLLLRVRELRDRDRGKNADDDDDDQKLDQRETLLVAYHDLSLNKGSSGAMMHRWEMPAHDRRMAPDGPSIPTDVCTI